MSKLINGVHHIALKCAGAEEFKKTIDFYTKTLGLDVIRSWGEGDDAGIMVGTGSLIVEIFAAGKEAGSTGSIHHFAVDVDDTDACIKAVRDAGYEITMEPTEVTIPSQPPFPIRIGFCVGPVGEVIEFFHVK